MPTIAGQCFIFYFVLLSVLCLAKDAHIVARWADKLGTELWELANEIAQPEEFLEKYKSMNVRVENKSGEDLVNIISENVGRMLRRKMDAVTCIRLAAEEAAENWDPSFADGNFSYISSKCSSVIGHDSAKKESCKRDGNVYRDMELISDSHFYNIPVNTSYSSVHIPTDVYDLTEDVIRDISKTEPLDDMFRQNYESDPALSWQYFGSVTGVLRQYPAMQWRMNAKNDDDDDDDNDDDDSDEDDDNYENSANLYDCRTRSWFIEAATCSKDVIILMDVSGSMTGMKKTIAKKTVSSILQTLSNNDYVTIIKYSDEPTEMVPCFKDMLIQATPENLDTFKEFMKKIDTQGIANLTKAFNKAFNLLETYREKRGCDVDAPCNQLIMFITDDVTGGKLEDNLMEVFKKWNMKENSTYLPVRIFTYLIGKEATKMDEYQWMEKSCVNSGDYKYVHTQKEVRAQVLKYIPVVARPLVLQNIHPIMWTHTYADITNPALAAWLWLVMKHKEQKSRLQKYLKGKQLGVRINEDSIYIQQLHKDENIEEDPSTLNTTAWQEYRLLTSVSTPVFDRNMTNSTNDTLLGVAGTDVPISDIRKLTLPYKLGVDGYAFIVSNNGYVIFHPDLRPVYKGKLKLNYNSIDLTEVEILDDGRGPRDPGPEILALRSALVNHERGSMIGIPVKFHYDKHRRVNLEKRDYFYAPLPGTPFSLAVAISNYGTTRIKVGDEIRKNQNMNVNVSDYFMGDNWRIHPSWIYCRYHYLEGHKFTSLENELRHFLALINRPGWRWSEQYEAYPSIDENIDEEPNCGRQTLKHDDYYCNKELMQLLVFDAKATNDSFHRDYVENLSPRIRDLAHRYGIFVKFIATQSGLTRWHYLKGSKLPKSFEGLAFGDLYKRAVNEPWYKGAIFQNELNPNSISLSVPREAGMDPIVTVSMSLSPKDGGKKAPVAVVGFQMLMEDLYKHFITLTSETTNPKMNCSHNWIDCYLLDQNGYVVISEAYNDTGQFMGTQEGAVMMSMVNQGLYNPVDIYDYQAWCQEVQIKNSANSLMEPLQYAARLLLWFLLRLMWFATQFVNLPGIHGKVHNDEDLPAPPLPPKRYLYHYSCDQKRTLYMLNRTVAAKGVTTHPKYCSRPFYAQGVGHTNLVLVVVNSLFPTCYKRLEVGPVSISPLEYTNGIDDKPCHKIPLNNLKKRKLKNCFSEYIPDHENHTCGGSALMMSFSLLCMTVVKMLYIFV